MKTIKQIADEIGVSKQAVFYRIKKEPLSNVLTPFISNEKGVLKVDFDGEMLIKKDFDGESIEMIDDNLTSIDGKKPSKPNKTNTLFDGEFIELLKENIQVLQEQLKVKDKQLESKDKQIEELTVTIRLQAESINAAHKNELAETIIDGRQVLINGEPNTNEVEEKKRGFFKKRFGKK